MPDNPLLKVPPARRGNRTGAWLGSPREAGGTCRRGANVNSGSVIGITTSTSAWRGTPPSATGVGASVPLRQQARGEHMPDAHTNHSPNPCKGNKPETPGRCSTRARFAIQLYLLPVAIPRQKRPKCLRYKRRSRSCGRVGSSWYRRWRRSRNAFRLPRIRWYGRRWSGRLPWCKRRWRRLRQRLRRWWHRTRRWRRRRRFLLL
jgi:hypothetical protein